MADGLGDERRSDGRADVRGGGRPGRGAGRRRGAERDSEGGRQHLLRDVVHVLRSGGTFERQCRRGAAGSAGRGQPPQLRLRHEPGVRRPVHPGPAVVLHGDAGYGPVHLPGGLVLRGAGRGMPAGGRRLRGPPGDAGLPRRRGGGPDLQPELRGYGAAASDEPVERPAQVAHRVRARQPAAPAERRAPDAATRVGEPHPAAHRLPRADAVDVVAVEPAAVRGGLLGAVQQVAPRAVRLEQDHPVDLRPVDRDVGRRFLDHRLAAGEEPLPEGVDVVRNGVTQLQGRHRAPLGVDQPRPADVRGHPHLLLLGRRPGRHPGAGDAARARAGPGRPLRRPDRLRHRDLRAGLVDPRQLDAEPGRAGRPLQLGGAAAERTGRHVGAGAHVPGVSGPAVEHALGADRRGLRRVR